eukprot:TRINITY_DN111077_c0_g1_i1.p1 TRINITY_DN111077_c0_g1~~TRINITY_DN111077_c0_g1_i1.p1  ORF type:complete len:382 (-),score=39.69 TRINITY_DN111077_c0_g1_i1:9-1082(-)
MARRRDLPSSIIEDQALASYLLAMTSQGTLRALSQASKRWYSDTFALAPSASRTLATLTRWPQEIDDTSSNESRSVIDSDALQLELAAKRASLVERLRMSCQDEKFGPSVPAPTVSAGGRVSSSSSTWFDQPAFRDRRNSDFEIQGALQRGTPGDVERLLICSSSVTDEGLSKALELHWDGLVRLCIGSGGHGKITGAALYGLRKQKLPKLRYLNLIDIVDLPISEIARKCPNLRSFSFRGRLQDTSGVEALAECPNLETLRLSLEPRIPHLHFVRVFRSCTSLNIIDIHGATDISDQLLGGLMLNTSDLKEFSASHSGGFTSSSGALTPHMVAAFKAHFSQARRIFIENMIIDSLL